MSEEGGREGGSSVVREREGEREVLSRIHTSSVPTKI